MKKTFSIILSIILVMVFAITSVGLAKISVKSIKLDNSKITMKVGATCKLNAVITPANASDTKLLYSTSNKRIATVDKDGKITAVKQGKAVIYVKSSSNTKISAKCSVTVSKAISQVAFNLWIPGHEPTIKSTFEGIVSKYKQQCPNIEIVYTQIPWNEYFAKLNVAYAGNAAPDVHGLGYGQFGQLVTQSKLLAYSKDWKEKDDIFPSIIEAGSYKGELYGLLLPEVRPLIYRKDYFQEAGLDPNKPPKDWNELQEYAIKLTKREGDKVVIAGMDVPTSGGEQMFQIMLLQLGTELWDNDGNPKLDSPEALKALKYLVDLKNKYNVIIPSDMQSVTGPVFMNGKAAMSYMQSQALPAIEASAPGKLGYALPTKEKTNTAFLAGTFICVSGVTKQKEEAFKLAEFIYSKENIWDIYKNINFLPVRKSLEEQFIADSPEKNKIFMECLKNSKGYSKNPTFLEDVNIIKKALEEAYYGKKTPEEALKGANDEIKAKRNK